MSNRFDEMVLDAVADVEDVEETRNGAVAPKKQPPTARNVVSISADDNPKRQVTSKPKVQRQETKRVGESDAVSTLARGLTRPLVTKTVRFRPELAEALNTVVLKNKLQGKKPDTIQDVLNEAAEVWLKRCGL